MKEIQKLLNNDQHIITALLKLTPIEISNSQNTLDTFTNNNKLLNDIGDFYRKRKFLSPKQIALIRPMLQRKANLLAISDFNISNSQYSFTVSSEIKPKQFKNADKKDQFTIKLSFNYNKELIAQIKEIAGRKFISDAKLWEIPLTINNIEKIKSLEFTLSYPLSQWEKEFKEKQAVADTIHIPKLDNILHGFQKQGVAFVQGKNGRALIADEQGLGKTLQSIAWIEANKNNDIYPIIIICPAAVKINWQKEFNKFINLNPEIISGRQTYPVSNNIIIINYDILRYWENEIIYTIKPRTIITDEIHKCKGDSKRQKSLTKISKHVLHFIGLTGTPILNRPIEILYPIRMINPNLFPSIKNFKYRYCGPKFNGFAMEFKGATNTIELNQILTKNLMIRRKKEDVLHELPDKIMSVIPLEISNRSAYNYAKTDLINFLKEQSIEKAQRAERAKTLAMINTLKQLAVKGKLKNSIEWINDSLDEINKMVVFVHHKTTVDLLMETFKTNAVKYVGGMTDKQRNNAEEQFWNDDSIKIFIGNIEAAGTGINLQIASNVVFIEYPWSPGSYAQATDRCHRMGQKNAVNIWNLIAQHTIEEQIISLIEQKSKVISQVIDGNVDEDNGIFNQLIKSFYTGGGF